MTLRIIRENLPSPVPVRVRRGWTPIGADQKRKTNPNPRFIPAHLRPFSALLRHVLKLCSAK
jgi:hypothetical protein